MELHRMDTPENVWFLMARNLSGEATTEEQEELMKLLQQNPHWMQHYDMMKTLWKPAAEKQDPDETSDKIRHILQTAESDAGQAVVVPISRRYASRRRFLWIAAAIAIIALPLVVAQYLGFNMPGVNSQQEIIAQKGSKTRTVLPDGSTVWLNAGSKISFPTEFNSKSRNVTLQGEAYFDVVKQPGRPFIVQAADINITVLGTAFNVKSYAEDKTVETTLIRGLVQITRVNDKVEKPIFLRPNQKIVLNKNSQESQNDDEQYDAARSTTRNDVGEHVLNLDSTRKENERIETAWVYNRLEFRGDNFEVLGLKLERWYNINIHFEDEEVKKQTFNGSLEMETVEQAFQALRLAAPFSYEIKGNEIYVKTMQ